MTEDFDHLAAEYALGTLDRDERARAEALLRENLDFRRAVERWERRLAPLGEGVAPVAPSRDVWAGVVRRLDEEAAARWEPANDNTAVAALRRSRARWRAGALGATLSAGALAAALAVFVSDRDASRRPSDQPGAYLAAVNRGGDKPALIVRVDLATHSVTVRPVEAETPPGKSLELWLVAGGRAPKSMGVLAPDRRERMAMPADMPMGDAVFAVSVEPPGGSPSGAPTGPIVYKGALIPE